MSVRGALALATVAATVVLAVASRVSAAEPAYTVTEAHEIAGTVTSCPTGANRASYEAQHPLEDFRPTVRVTTSKDAVLADVRVDDEGRFTVPLRFDGRYTVVVRRVGCVDRVLARVPRGSRIAVALDPFVWRDNFHARSLCAAFQPTQPTLTYTLTSSCLSRL